MSVVLRVIAGLVMLLGLVTLAATIYGMAARPVRGIGFGWLLDAGGLLAVPVALTLGGVLWALTRIAYQSPAISPALPTSIPPPVLPERNGMGWMLWIIALMQVGLGITAFVFAYIAIYWPRVPPQEPSFGELLTVTILSWCYACLGGILLALTRIAYPPTLRPEAASRAGLPHGPANA